MATQDVLDQTVTQLTALATPSTAVADLDTQIAALFVQVQTLQAQRDALAPESVKARQLLQQLRQTVGRGGGGQGLRAQGGLVINTPSIAAVQAAQTAPDVVAPAQIATPST